ncbi:MAG: 16S rRNA processing protein RimM [Clostridia bacterium]|nr:16S rRNA processing protein RimM [Clostridia bacterium]
MIKDYLDIGQIVGTHGVRGEMRVNPRCDGPEFIKQFKTLYFDKKGEKAIKVIASRVHGNLALLKLEGVDTVEKATALRNKILYMKRSDAKIPDGSYFIAELIDCRVIDADDESIYYGTLSDVSETGANDVWHIRNSEGKEYLLPAIPPVVIDVNVETGIIKIRPLKGIFDDED